MRKIVLLSLLLSVSLPTFAEPQEECLRSLHEQAKINEVKANRRAVYIRKVIDLLTDEQKWNLVALRRLIAQAQASLQAAKALRVQESERISDALENFKKGPPPAGHSVEQTVQALERAQSEEKEAQKKSEMKVAQAGSDFSNQEYRLKGYAYPIFKNDGGSLKAKFQTVIEEALENGYVLQFGSTRDIYIDHIVIQEGKHGFERNPGSGYPLGSGKIYLFADYFNSRDPEQSAASYEQLAWKSLSQACRADLSKHNIYGQDKLKETLPAF